MTVFSEIVLPKLIFQTSTPYNERVEVWQYGKHLKLIVNGSVESTTTDTPSAKNSFLGRTVDLLLEHEPNMERVLVLGLGGGTMQHFISEKFPQKPEIVSVDIDEKIVEVSREYFDLDLIPNHRVIVDDACRVVVEPEKYGLMEHMFDAVVVDLFIGDKYPELGRSGNFVAGVKRLLKPGGLVVFNRIYHGHHQDEVNMFIEMLHDFYSEVNSLIIAGKTNSDNVLIYGRAN